MEKMEESKWLVKESTLNELLNYLAGRPYGEVYKLIEKAQMPQVEKHTPCTCKCESDEGKES